MAKQVDKNTESARRQYLQEAVKDVQAGMEPKAFREKWGGHTQYDEDDWLMLRNFLPSTNRYGTNNSIH